jgi:hypothetical protein
LFKNWTNRDWFWITGILITIIITCFAFFLSENDRVVEIFSFLASGVSIALAFVAIYVSSNQNKESQSLSQSMSDTLARMSERVNSVNEKVDKIDPMSVSRILEGGFKDLKQDLKENIPEVGKVSQEELINKFQEKIDLLQSEMNYQIENEMRSEKDIETLATKIRIEVLADHIGKIFANGKMYTIKEIKKILENEYDMIANIREITRGMERYFEKKE